jgi:hypothetical protein
MPKDKGYSKKGSNGATQSFWSKHSIKQNRADDKGHKSSSKKTKTKHKKEMMDHDRSY